MFAIYFDSLLIFLNLLDSWSSFLCFGLFLGGPRAGGQVPVIIIIIDLALPISLIVSVDPYVVQISVIGVYVFLYGQLYLVLSGLQRALLHDAQTQNIKSLETALASQSFLQLGLLTGLPMVMELGLEKGFRAALSDFILMQLQLASVFFTFSLGTKAHYYGRTILHGGAKYRPTGRKFVVFHASFTENYQLYSRSHFVKGFELVFLLIVYHIFRRSYVSSVLHVMITYSTWFMAVTWLFTPFLFNPAGFAWHKIVEDWADWNRWMRNQGGIGVQPEKSWESWWNAENAHLRHSVLSSRILEVLLSLRFFIYQYGLVYHLNISQDNKNFLVYLLSWVVIIAIIGLVKVPASSAKNSLSFHATEIHYSYADSLSNYNILMFI
jgi:callose synthase